MCLCVRGIEKVYNLTLHLSIVQLPCVSLHAILLKSYYVIVSIETFSKFLGFICVFEFRLSTMLFHPEISLSGCKHMPLNS